jgi:hypothetical protein
MKNELWNQTGGFIKIQPKIISLNFKEGRKEGWGRFSILKKSWIWDERFF